MDAYYYIAAKVAHRVNHVADVVATDEVADRENLGAAVAIQNL